MTEKLLPCPFCGDEPEFIEGADDDGRWIAVGCPTCGCGSRQHYPIMDDARPDLSSAWNTRQPPQSDGWRTVDDCPNGGPPVLVFGGRRTEVQLGPADGDYWRSNKGSGATPTHWMPTPAPPAGEKG